MKDLSAELAERKAAHLYRSRRISDTPQQVEMNIDGRDVISFCSNDYLGLANHPQVRQAFIDGVERYGVGSGAAHLINGHSRAHHELELALAAFTGQPRALLLSTGYMANIGIAQALIGRADTVLEDRLNHASLIDAGLLSGARLMRYRHNDADDLASRLEQREGGNKLVMTDAVFSMDGDLADLPGISDTCKQHDAMLVIDDAHGFGVLGEAGRGSLSHLDVQQSDDMVYMATLGKAVGTAGAFVVGSDDLIETLIQQARTYIYTTAQPPAVAVATLKSLQLLQSAGLQQQLKDNIRYFRNCAEQAGIELDVSMTAIQPIIIGDSRTCVSISEKLYADGILVTAIRPPTVPQGTARLRITLCAQHTKAHIERLIAGLARRATRP